MIDAFIEFITQLMIYAIFVLLGVIFVVPIIVTAVWYDKWQASFEENRFFFFLVSPIMLPCWLITLVSPLWFALIGAA